MGPLEGIKVLDLTQFQSGPLCTMIMSDLGAEVIKLENPKTGGDPSRYEGISVNKYTTAYASPNRGKKSMLMDLQDEQQKALFFKMVEDADAVIDNFQPGTLEKYGCDYEVLRKINPKIVCTSISYFGQTGPMKDCIADDMIIQGLSGLMSMVGDLGGRPVKVGVDIADKLAGFYGCIGTLTAIYEAMQTGKGCRVDISEFDSVIAAMEAPYARYDMTGSIPTRQGNRHPSAVPFGNYACEDGRELIVNITTDDQFAKFVDALGAPEVADGDFKYAAERIKARDEVEKVIKDLFSQWDADELVAELDARKLPYSVANDIGTISDSEHAKAHNMIVDVTFPDGTTMKCAGTPLKYNDMEDKTQFTASPLGYDTIEVASRYMGKEKAHELYDDILKEASFCFAEKTAEFA